MSDYFSLFGLVVTALYGLVSISYIYLFTQEEEADKFRKKIRVAASFASLCHLMLLLLMAVELNRLPMASVHEAVYVLTFFLGAMYIMIHYTSGEKGTGFFIFPVIFLLQAWASISFQEVEKFNQILSSPFFTAHTIPSIMAFSSLMIAMLYSAMYLLMFSQIKSRKFGLLFNALPSLDALDKLNVRAVLIGFWLLTAGAATGIIWGTQAWENVSVPKTDPKILSTQVIWIIYLITILVRKFFGWQGKRVAIMSIVGGVMIFVSFFIISYLFPSVHDFS